tara:strand:- start:5761 stop:7359 length:1599 start_codon:yes stop_codon:yes gene_type:complete
MPPKPAEKRKGAEEEEPPSPRFGQSRLGKYGDDAFWEASYREGASPDPVTYSGHDNPASRGTGRVGLGGGDRGMGASRFHHPASTKDQRLSGVLRQASGADIRRQHLSEQQASAVRSREAESQRGSQQVSVGSFSGQQVSVRPESIVQSREEDRWRDSSPLRLPARIQESMEVALDTDTQANPITDRLGEEIQMYQPLQGQQRYSFGNALRQGSVAVAALAYLQATQMGSAVVAGMGETKCRMLGRNILWSMPPQVLECLVGDNLAARARTEDSLVDLFHQDSDWMYESTTQAPIIYVLILANEDGCSLAASQLRKVIEVLRKYISNDHRDIDEVAAVDNALNAGRSSQRQVEQGFQRFLHKTKHGRRTVVRGRQEIVEQFCEALERRLDTTVLAGMEDVPLTRPLMYIGYALHFASRMEDHDHGESSVLIQLVRSVSRYLYGGEFELQSFPVCFLAEEDEVRLAELLLTQLANSFSWTGGGFNIHPPGMNNSSADLRDWEVGAAKDFWQQRRAFRSDQGFWHAARMTDSMT